MAKKKIDLFSFMEQEDYHMVWHISALSSHRYRVAITSSLDGIVDEVTYAGKDFEQCLSMKQVASKKGEKMFLEIESDSDEIDIYEDAKFDDQGYGQSICYFIKGGEKANYHELCIILWGVLDESANKKNQDMSLVNDYEFNYPLRDLAHLTCLSYFFCFHKNEDIQIQLSEKLPGQQKIEYLNENYVYSKDNYHLVSGSALTRRHGLDLYMKLKGSQIQAYIDSTKIAGSNQTLVHYHIKSSVSASGNLPFSMDIIGWTDMNE